MRRQWLSPNSSFHQAPPWRMYMAWCQGTATTTSARMASSSPGRIWARRSRRQFQVKAR